MNFQHDLAELARKIMIDEGVSVPKDWDDYYVCIKYLELSHRWFDSSIPYRVVFSKELQVKIPSLTESEQKALLDIIDRLKNCSPITPYMSKDINKSSLKRSDFILKKLGYISSSSGKESEWETIF